MKLLIVLLAILLGVWLWRRGRTVHRPGATASERPRRALPMVACDRCGLHVPQPSVVHGKRGEYCCEGHRREAEGD